MLKKILYTAPVAEPLVVQAEGLVCTSGEGEFGIGGFTPDSDVIDFTTVL